MTHQTLRDGRSAFGTRPNAIYEVLGYLPPGLMLDVGAAVGMTTKLMLQHSPRSNVIAIEPFPGNHEHFRRRIGDDSRVTLLRMAATDTTEPQWFYVSGTVQSGTPGWAGFEGSSSLGYLIGPDDDRVGKGFRVSACRLDDVVDNREVIFTKMDIQGGEARALRGAASALNEGRLKVLFVEFGGDLNVLETMLDHGYEFYDHEYFLIPRSSGEPDLGQWKDLREGTLSTNRRFYRAWPRNPPNRPEDFCEFFRLESAKIGSVGTDLVFVSSEFMSKFEAALRDYRKLNDQGSIRHQGSVARRFVAGIPGARRLVRGLRTWRAGRGAD